MQYEAVIGLEVHAQLLTESKLFSQSSTKFGASPNTQVNPICLGMPGVLPVLNKKSLEYAVKAAYATNCRIAPRSRFARKNYFYPDLPKGYQISQFEHPFSHDGWLEIKTSGDLKQIRIKRIHLEEDAGKLIHDISPTSTYVDLNRAGVPLIEIVSEPDISSPEEAVEYVKKLRSILRYIGVCDGNMEEGSLRCDANVSVRRKGTDRLGTKTEVKNLNSFKFIQRAIEYEIERHVSVLAEGGRIDQETRLFDSKRGTTFAMRSKEEAHDYRYFPDPDLLPLIFEKDWLDELRESLPELPDKRLLRFIEDYDLSSYDASILTSSKELADYYEECLAYLNKPREVSNWILTEVLREIGQEDDIVRFPITPKMTADLLGHVDNGTISRNMAKDVFQEMIKTGDTAEEIVEKKGLKQITDTSELESEIEKILDDHPDEVTRFKQGEGKLLGFFVGQVMKATKGKANPKLVNEILRKYLSGREG